MPEDIAQLADEDEDLDLLDEEPEPRGCAWLAPWVIGLVIILELVFFIYANSAPIRLAIFPMVEVNIRPPVVVLLSILIGVGLTYLVAWARHRAAEAAEDLEDPDEGEEL